MKIDFKADIAAYAARRGTIPTGSRVTTCPRHPTRCPVRVGGPLLDAMRLERFDEGLCVQTHHVGSYDDEAAVLDAMHHEFIPAQELRMTGKHHDTYLSHSRRTQADKLRSILRQPVAPAGEEPATADAGRRPGQTPRYR